MAGQGSIGKHNGHYSANSLAFKESAKQTASRPHGVWPLGKKWSDVKSRKREGVNGKGRKRVSGWSREGDLDTQVFF